MSRFGLFITSAVKLPKNEPIYVETISYAMVTFVLIFPEHRQDSLSLVQRFQRFSQGLFQGEILVWLRLDMSYLQECDKYRI